MKLSRSSEYALHALAYLSSLEPNKLVPSHLMAQAQGIPERFLLKILKPLVWAGLLRSVKGPNGGYCLAKRPSQISLLDIIEAADGPLRGRTPLSGTKGADKLDVRLEEVCNRVAEMVRKHLAKTSVSDLAK